MKHPRSRQPSTPDESSARTTPDIDALYGLEPVFEPGRDSGGDSGRESGQAPGTATFHRIQCPYCGERFETLVDTGAGSSAYIEDCQVCCQPIEFELEVDSRGAFAGLGVRRG